MHRDWPLFALPLMMVAVLGISVLVSATPRPIVWARVYGGPTDAETWHGRLQVRRERSDVSQPLSQAEVRLRWVSSRGETMRSFTTGPDGWTEFRLPRPRTRKDETLRLVVEYGAEHDVIAEGEPEVTTERFTQSARRRGGDLSGHAEGPTKIELRLSPPVLSVPFAAQLTLNLEPRAPPSETGAKKEPFEVELTAEGLDFESERLTMTPGERETLTIHPRQHVVTLKTRVRPPDGPPSSRFTPLPVIPGSMGLSEQDDHLLVSSPVGKPEAWYAVVGSWGRGPGGRIELDAGQRDESTSRGRIPRSVLPDRPDRYLLLASTPDGRSPSTVGYPLDGQPTTFDAWDAFVIDSGPLARQAEARRLRKVRWVLGGYAALCGLATLILFVRRVRLADQELARNLRRAGAGTATRDRSPFPAAVAVFSLLFAFSLAVLWIVAR